MEKLNQYGVAGNKIYINNIEYYSENTQSFLEQLQNHSHFDIEVESKKRTIVIIPERKEIIDDEVIVQEEVTEEVQELISIDFQKTLEVEFIEKQTKITEIKARCKEDILARYSESDQANMNQRATLIIGLAQAEKRDFSEKELKELKELKEAREWTDTRLGACQAEIDNL